jgi:hypothetical protein
LEDLLILEREAILENYTKFPAMLCLVELGLEQREPGKKNKVRNEYPYRLGFLWKMLKKLFKTRILGVE